MDEHAPYTRMHNDAYPFESPKVNGGFYETRKRLNLSKVQNAYWYVLNKMDVANPRHKWLANAGHENISFSWMRQW